MSKLHIERSIALRNALASRIERERKTLIDLGYSPDTADAIMATAPARAAIFAQRKYLAKNWASGAYKRARAARAKVVQVEPKPIRDTFDEIFAVAA